MASLLSLPRELRDTIIDHVITSDRRSPPIALEGNTDSEGAERVQFEDTHWKEIGNLIYFEKSPAAFQPSFGGLLLACQQLRSETLERASKFKVPYVLDILIVSEEKIWVTWLSMPCNRGSVIDGLTINVRMQCDGYDWTVSTKTDNFTLVFGTQMRNLLYRILAVGCAGPIPDDKRRKLWVGARYKFNDTIRFEHEYLAHYSIRKVGYYFSDMVLSEVGRRSHQDPGFLVYCPLLVNCYAREWTEVVEMLVGHNVVFNNQKHPGWRLAPERIGGLVIGVGRMLTFGDWANFGPQYMMMSDEYPEVANTLQELLVIRDKNGL
ncbi:hypothetical protein GRF29_185g1205152 [Pseudopithomyces chartarum]|uniref:Uncharacterized protein n=1 Tax=Pseudopithomyces chartarum TaxID=1892770 RepID=A0AAN6RDT8_9PLEO|nr:hypothetical protein GRF29_185g1205152 [Pseudopithomyces chartarum]